MSVKSATNKFGAGRPKAEDLRVRCEGFNRLGHRCGLAPIEGEKVCNYHLGEVDRAVKESMAERLRQGADEAVARLRQVVRDGDNGDAVRAAAILLDRVAPKMSSTQALVINVGGDGAQVDPGRTAADVVRGRLLELAAVTAARQAAEEDEIIDAELVEDEERRFA